MLKGIRAKFWGNPYKCRIGMRLRLSETQYKRLMSIAEFEDRRLSLILRQAIEEFILKKWSYMRQVENPERHTEIERRQ